MVTLFYPTASSQKIDHFRGFPRLGAPQFSETQKKIAAGFTVLGGY